jgi:VWFA-related protein
MRIDRAVCLAILLLSSLAIAQSESKEKSADTKDVPTFHSRSDLVFVPVVVKRHGAHVAGLKKEDFRIEQDGKAQEISVFEEVSDASPATAAIPSAAPGVVSNYSVVDQHPRRVLIVVLDMVNTPFLNQKRAKEALIKYLATSAPKDEPIALFAFGATGLKQLHPFTTDTGVLVAALKKVSSRISATDTLAPSIEETGLPIAAALEAAEAQHLYEWLSNSIATENAFRHKGSIELTLLAMQQVAGTFAGVPGRKAMLWATDGFPLLLADPTSFVGLSTEMVDKYESTWRLLNAANIAIYPIGLEGVVADGFDASKSSLPKEQLFGARGTRQFRYDDRQQRHDAMRSFADNTGGRAFLNNNDALNGFKEASGDSRSYYILGYYLRAEAKTGWHKLKVHANSPHSDVRAREGFYIGDKNDDPKLKRQEFVVALDSPVDYTGIHFSIKVDPQTPLDSASKQQLKRNVTMKLMLPVNYLSISPDYKLDIDLAAIAFRKDGTAAGESSGAMHATIRPDSFQKLLETGLTIKAAVQVPSGEYELRVGVRDNANGNIGTLRTQLIVQ